MPHDPSSRRTFPLLNMAARMTGHLAVACLLVSPGLAADAVFETPVLYPSDVHAWAGLDDMDGDGDIDLVLVHDSACPWSCPPRIKVWPNDGSGTFGAPAIWETDGFQPYSIEVALGDFDGDDLSDVAYTDGASIALRTSNGDGSFTFHSSMATPSGLPPRWLRAGDVDDDGDTDLLFVDRSAESNLVVARNNGDATFVQEINAGIPNGSEFADLGDLDDDGDLDLVSGTSGEFAVWLNDGDGAYAEHVFYLVDMTPASPHIADLDGDELPDIVLGSNGNLGGTPYTEVWRNIGAGQFSYLTNVGAAVPSSQHTSVADFDGDDTVDILIGRTDTDEIALWVNDGFAGFTLEGTYSAGVDPVDFGSADMDGDGRNDVVTRGGDDFALVRNAGPQVCELDWNCDGVVTRHDRADFLQDIKWYITYHDTAWADYVEGGYYHKRYCGYPGDLDWDGNGLINALDYQNDDDPTYSSYVYEWYVRVYYPQWYGHYYPDGTCPP